MKMTIGEKIKELRLTNGISQPTLAKAIGVANSVISNWENDRNIPRADYIIQIAQFFNVTTDYVLNNEEGTASIEEERKEGIRIIALTEEEYIKLLQALNNATRPQETDEFSYTDGVHTINHKKGSKKQQNS